MRTLANALLIMVVANTQALQPPVATASRRSLAAARSPLPVLSHSVKSRGATVPPRSLAASWIQAGVPKWVTLIDEALFVAASAMFVRGSLDFYPDVSMTRYLEGCQLFTVGSVIYLLLAIFAAYEALENAKLTRTPVPPAAIFEQALYVTGSVLFLAGTALFTPDLPVESISEAAAAMADDAVRRPPPSPPPTSPAYRVLAPLAPTSRGAHPRGLGLPLRLRRRAPPLHALSPSLYARPAGALPAPHHRACARDRRAQWPTRPAAAACSRSRSLAASTTWRGSGRCPSRPTRRSSRATSSSCWAASSSP